jgi:hypothetical protein
MTEKSSSDSATLQEIKALATEGSILAGPGMEKIVPDAIDIYPDAMTLCGIAAQTQTFVEAARLEPIICNPITFTKAAR